MRWFGILAAGLVTVGLAPPAAAQIAPIGPFTGTIFDNFNNDGQPGTGGKASVVVFSGFCTVVNTTQGGSLKIEFSSNLGGDQVDPRSPPAIFGQLGISEWTFNSPVTRWGGYWENNSRFDDATVNFFDANNNLIGTMVADDKKAAQTWTWNGWQSTVPFTKVRVTGNDVGFLNGFIWWEDFNVTVASVPEPNTYALLGLTAVIVTSFFCYRRRQASRSPDLV